MKNVLDCEPIFSTDMLAYKRIETDGCISVIPYKHQEVAELLLNEISTYILDQCNSRNTISDIVDNILHEYQIGDRELVINDTVNSLITLWRYGCLEWESETPYDYLYIKKNGDICFKLLSEDEFYKCEDIIEKGYYITPSFNRETFYSKKFVGQRICFLSEIFFLLTITNQYISRISFFNTNNINSLEIGSLFVNGNFNDHVLIRDFINWSINEYNKAFRSTNSQKVTRLIIFIDKNKFGNLQNVIEKVGFTQVGIMKNEYGYGTPDLSVYEYLLALK